MQISKTQFKEFSRCKRASALYDLYKNKTLHFSDQDPLAISLLNEMYDEQTGENLLTNEVSEVMQKAYQNVEVYAVQYLESVFQGKIEFSKKTTDQRVFSYTLNKDANFYAYLDGYLETEEDVYIFEVKATTSKKYLDLKQNKLPLFTKDQDVYVFKPTSEIVISKKTGYTKLLNRYTSEGQYVFDLSFQRSVIEQSKEYQRHKKYHYYLVCLNSNFVFDGNEEHLLLKDKNDEGLFAIFDMTEITQDYLTLIKKQMMDVARAVEDRDISPVPVGKFCEHKKESSCIFSKICWKKASEKGSILEYIHAGHGFKNEIGEKVSVFELINEGKVRLDSIPIRYLDRRINQLQRDCFDTDASYINLNKLKAGLSMLGFPIYHLDFESLPYPLPRFHGEKPYSQSVFMFSLHTQKDVNVCDFDQNHYTYLSKDTKDHREELIQSMIEHIDLSNGGTVLVYNKSFEIGRIQELAEIFPEYSMQLEKIIDHIFDLMDLVNTNTKLYQSLGFSEEESKLPNYYHNDLRGSYSIKKVLPLFSNLSYSQLEIQNGNQALEQYANYDTLEQEELEHVQEELIKYCKLDTWAMVVILQGLYKLIA